MNKEKGVGSHGQHTRKFPQNNNLNENKLDLARLNYGVITLIPKVQANEVKQYRPICVSNVILKIVTKMMTNRLTDLANLIVSKNQSA